MSYSRTCFTTDKIFILLQVVFMPRTRGAFFYRQINSEVVSKLSLRLPGKSVVQSTRGLASNAQQCDHKSGNGPRPRDQKSKVSRSTDEAAIAG